MDYQTGCYTLGLLFGGAQRFSTDKKPQLTAIIDTLGLPTHCLNYPFCCTYLVETTLCGMDNATSPPSEVGNATPSLCGMDTRSPCGMDNAPFHVD